MNSFQNRGKRREVLEGFNCSSYWKRFINSVWFGLIMSLYSFSMREIKQFILIISPNASCLCRKK